jgi:hypothetical protein
MKRMVLFILVFVSLPVYSFSASLEPPWKCLIHNQKYEFWYDTSRIEKSANYIDVYTWEIYINEERMAYRHTKFNRANGKVAYGEAKGYKYGRLVADFDFSKTGFLFNTPGKEEKKLFKILQKQ